MTDQRRKQSDSDPEIIAAEYALGLLDENEEQTFRKIAAEHPVLADLADRWTARFDDLLDEAPDVAAPAGSEERLLARFEREKQASSRQDEAQKRIRAIAAPDVGSTLWSNLAFWRGLGIAATAVSCVLAFLVVDPVGLTGAPTDSASVGSTAQLVATLNPEQSGSYLITLASGQRIAGTTLADLSGEQRVPELWLVPDEGPTLSLGLLPQSGSTEFDIPPDLVDRLVEGALLAITLEPPGGAPGGIATGPIVATGNLVFEN